ncbi:MAG: hypothetical protein JWO73_63 [Candidatus Taylorbacteria bacterium]|nr:hypothetical protein [Candidatus Taylorbacteria bacterium]
MSGLALDAWFQKTETKDRPRRVSIMITDDAGRAKESTEMIRILLREHNHAGAAFTSDGNGVISASVGGLEHALFCELSKLEGRKPRLAN